MFRRQLLFLPPAISPWVILFLFSIELTHLWMVSGWGFWGRWGRRWSSCYHPRGTWSHSTGQWSVSAPGTCPSTLTSPGHPSSPPPPGQDHPGWPRDTAPRLCSGPSSHQTCQTPPPRPCCPSQLCAGCSCWCSQTEMCLGEYDYKFSKVFAMIWMVPLNKIVVSWAIREWNKWHLNSQYCNNKGCFDQLVTWLWVNLTFCWFDDNGAGIISGSHEWRRKSKGWNVKLTWGDLLIWDRTLGRQGSEWEDLFVTVTVAENSRCWWWWRHLWWWWFRCWRHCSTEERSELLWPVFVGGESGEHWWEYYC